MLNSNDRADVDEMQLAALGVGRVDADPAFVAADARVSVDSPFPLVFGRRWELAEVDTAVALEVIQVRRLEAADSLRIGVI